MNRNNALWKLLENQIGYQPIILDSSVVAKDNYINLTFNEGSYIFLSKLFSYLSELEIAVSHVLAHLTIKGNFIWDKENPQRYLDGEVFGFCEEGKENIDIHLPSGDGRRGGDFEMWFWLVPEIKGSISGTKYLTGKSGQSPEPLARWPIILKKEDRSVVKSKTTDDNGKYIFEELPLGKYKVEEDLNSQNEFKQVYPPLGYHEVEITINEKDIKDIDFCNNRDFVR